MQNKNNNQKGTMTKIRMNTELRNKLFNKIKNVFENEDTQEKEAYLQSREDVDRQYEQAHRLAVDVVERSYPPEDVSVLRTFKKKYGSPCDVVAKDKCFYFAHNEGVDDEGEPTETKSHFDFGLFGNLNGSEYSGDEGKKFAFAYYREDLKAMDCNPDIYAQQMRTKITHTKQNMLTSVLKHWVVVVIVIVVVMIKVWLKLLMTNTILMSLEHLTVVQEQSHVLKMSTNNLKLGELQKVI